MFTSYLLNSAGELTTQGAFISIAASVVCGLIIAFLYMYKSEYSRNFAVSLVILPALVAVVITVVNGNLGAAVSVMGAFSLVRFRSAPGSSKDITAIFFAMAAGLANGMGYVVYSAAIVLMVGAVYLILVSTGFGKKGEQLRHLKVLVPESLDYTEIFDDIFDKYVNKAELAKVKTTDLGSIFELNYDIEMKDKAKEKDFIDELRTRNGNLTIICGRPVSRVVEEM